LKLTACALDCGKEEEEEEEEALGTVDPIEIEEAAAIFEESSRRER